MVRKWLIVVLSFLMMFGSGLVRVNATEADEVDLGKVVSNASDLISTYYNDASFTYDENSKKVTFTATVDGDDYSVEFTYNDGILTFVEQDDMTFNQLTFENCVVFCLFESILNYRGYTSDAIDDFFDVLSDITGEDFTIEDDGICYTLTTLSYSAINTSGGTNYYSVTGFKTFSISLRNDFSELMGVSTPLADEPTTTTTEEKTTTTQEESTENPSTDFGLSHVVGLSAIVGVMALFVIKKKRYI